MSGKKIMLSLRGLKIEIHGKRLFLRTLEASDVSDEYISWLNDPVVSRFLESRFSLSSWKSVRNFVRENLSSGDSILMGIFLQDSQEHVGNIRIYNIDGNNLSAEIGFLIGSQPNWGKGYASEAIELAVRFGSGELGIEKFTAGLIEQNIGSKRALEKVGFVVEGLLIDQVMNSDGSRGNIVRMGLTC